MGRYCWRHFVVVGIPPYQSWGVQLNNRWWKGDCTVWYNGPDGVVYYQTENVPQSDESVDYYKIVLVSSPSQ
jgi:hypothetical protein